MEKKGLEEAAPSTDFLRTSKAMPFLQGEDNLDSREIHQKKPPAEGSHVTLAPLTLHGTHLFSYTAGRFHSRISNWYPSPH